MSVSTDVSQMGPLPARRIGLRAIIVARSSVSHRDHSMKPHHLSVHSQYGLCSVQCILKWAISAAAVGVTSIRALGGQFNASKRSGDYMYHLL
jgi:hypothetical protein